MLEERTRLLPQATSKARWLLAIPDTHISRGGLVGSVLFEPGRKPLQAVCPFPTSLINIERCLAPTRRSLGPVTHAAVISDPSTNAQTRHLPAPLVRWASLNSQLGTVFRHCILSPILTFETFPLH